MSFDAVQDSRGSVKAFEMCSDLIIKHAEGFLLEDRNPVVVVLCDGLINGAKVDLVSGDHGNVEQF